MESKQIWVVVAIALIVSLGVNLVFLFSLPSFIQFFVGFIDQIPASPQIEETNTLTVNSLVGEETAYVCANSEGQLFRSQTPCA